MWRLATVASLVLCAAAHGQIRYHVAAAVPQTDPIYPLLMAHQAAMEKEYEKKKLVQGVFREWVKVESAAAARLFPRLRFASVSWSLKRHPDNKGQPVSLAFGLETTLAIDTAAKRVVKDLFCYGNYATYGKLLVEHKVPLRDAVDAKLVWDAFCDIHHRHWQSHPFKKISASEWQLGIYQYDQTVGSADGLKKVVTQTHYTKVLVDPKTSCITSWESRVDSSNERFVPTDK